MFDLLVWLTAQSLDGEQSGTPRPCRQCWEVTQGCQELDPDLGQVCLRNQSTHLC